MNVYLKISLSSVLKGWWGAERQIIGINLSGNHVTVEIST
jgi:hypothetical protein